MNWQATLKLDGSGPLYEQIKRAIVRPIRESVWKPGDRIPPEHDLLRHFSASRMTINRALRELAEEGYVTRHRRMGSFVAFPNSNPDAVQAGWQAEAPFVPLPAPELTCGVPAPCVIVLSVGSAAATISRVTNGQAMPKPPPCSTAQARISGIEPAGTAQAKPAMPTAIIAAPPTMIARSLSGRALATRMDSTDQEIDSAAMM